MFTPSILWINFRIIFIYVYVNVYRVHMCTYAHVHNSLGLNIFLHIHFFSRAPLPHVS